MPWRDEKEENGQWDTLLSIYMANAYEDTEIFTMLSFFRHILMRHFVENELATLANVLQD